MPEIEGLPENLVVEILGSRKNILFTEGEKNSYDTTLYQAIFPTFHIIPRGNCDKVIEGTKAFQGIRGIHHITAKGIIDSDYRTVEEIEVLLGHGIHTIQVAEIENLFCVDGLLEIVANHLELNPAEIIPRIHQFVFDQLRGELDTQIASRVEKEVQFRLNAFTKVGDNEQGITNGINAVVGAINVPALYAEATDLYQGILDRSDYSNALKYYNRKSLAKRISQFFGLANNTFPSLVLRLLKSERGVEIVNVLRPYVPDIDQ